MHSCLPHPRAHHTLEVSDANAKAEPSCFCPSLSFKVHQEHMFRPCHRPEQRRAAEGLRRSHRGGDAHIYTVRYHLCWLRSPSCRSPIPASCNLSTGNTCQMQKLAGGGPTLATPLVPVNLKAIWSSDFASSGIFSCHDLRSIWNPSRHHYCGCRMCHTSRRRRWVPGAGRRRRRELRVRKRPIKCSRIELQSCGAHTKMMSKWC